VKSIKSWWLVLAFVSGFGVAMWAEELILNWHNDRLEFTAPRVHFLGGKPLALLHNAAPVPFDFQMTIWHGKRDQVFEKLTDRFVVSYDLWEERFKVVKTQSPVKSIEHLTADKAEAWCFQQMSASLDLTNVNGAEPLWARVDIRAQDAKGGSLFGRGSISDMGISLTSLIEIFSRPADTQQSHWGPYDVGPFTLDELKRSPHRGS
jgi:hypothetical protein